MRSAQVKISLMSGDKEFDRLWNDSAEYDPEAGEERWIVRPGERKTIDVDDVSAVKAAFVDGRVDIIARDIPTARLEVSDVRGEEVRASLVNGTLRIGHPQSRAGLHNVTGLDVPSLLSAMFGRNRNRDSDAHTDGKGDVAYATITLLTPRDITVAMDCLNGDAMVSGVRGNVSLDTMSGTLLADQITGNLKLDTMSGKVEARNHRGNVRANSMSGDVIVSGACPRVKLDTMSGKLYFNAVGAPEKVSLDAMNGSAVISFDPSVHAHYGIDGMSGKAVINGHRLHGKSGGTLHFEDGPQDAPVTKVKVDAMRAQLTVVRRAADTASEAGSENATSGNALPENTDEALS